MNQESRHSLTKFFVSVSQATIVWVSCILLWRLNWGISHFPAQSGDGTIFLETFGLRISCFCWLLGRSQPQLPAAAPRSWRSTTVSCLVGYPVMATYFKAPRRVLTLAECNIIVEIIHHHLCHILWVNSKLQTPLTFKVYTKVRISGDNLESVYVRKIKILSETIRNSFRTSE